jgi:FHA domain-containing protein
MVVERSWPHRVDSGCWVAFSAPMGLQRFEQRLERLVEGVFAKAFRGGLQPVELGRRLVREMDIHRALSVGGTLVPNQFTIALSPDDRERLSAIEHTLVAELVDTARLHAREEGYRFPGAVTVSLVTDPHLAVGSFHVDGRMAEGGPTSGLVLADGSRFDLPDDPVTVGRAPDCDLVLADPTVSKHHFELRHQGADVVLVDLGSTNGTRVNDVGVRDRVLVDGDRIQVGATVLRFETV